MSRPITSDRTGAQARACASWRKAVVRDHADHYAATRAQWVKKGGYFHAADLAYLRFLIPPGKRVLDVGCGVGDLLAALEPSEGVGIDLSQAMVDVASRRLPDLRFIAGDVEDPATLAPLRGQTFDFIVLSDTIGALEDCQSTLEGLAELCDRDTRLVIAYHSQAWGPLLRLMERLELKMPQVVQNELDPGDINDLLDLAGFDVVKQERRMLLPARLGGLGPFINASLGVLPGVSALCLRNYTVGRALRPAAQQPLSVSVIIPCRNEAGNIEAAIRRLPRFGRELEVIFVEGHSRDGTWEEILRVAAAHGDQLPIRFARQDGVGKGDAVRKGFDMATGEVLMILDADLTVPPEDLPKFYDALVSGRGNFINGSRLVYPMEDQAMRFLNHLANRAFARIFSWLLNQRISDTLCGTKVLLKSHYDRIVAGRAYFGEFDPFGDFDLIFGASRANLRIVDIPVRYDARTYGETQISRFRHGLLLLRMVVFAFRKLKLV